MVCIYDLEKKGVVSDKMLRGVENKHRIRDVEETSFTVVIICIILFHVDNCN